MEVLNLVIIISGIILLSSLVSNLLTKISTPLIQILFGILAAVILNINMNIELDPELFLVLFIAPLLFNEANHIDKLGFWKNKGMIVSLALGLVVATVFVVGFVLNIFEPSIPLTAAFALGAALGPTDAVAVTSMSDRIPKKAKSILAGECLINDASGLVSFQFSVAATITGAFSLLNALEEFAFDFFGGVIFGLLAGFLLRGLLNLIRKQGFEDKMFNILFELIIPFIVYYSSEFLQVSGILAVVACEIVFSLTRSKETSKDSSTNLISSNIWNVVVYLLNGMVFTLLGLMLPGSIWKVAENEIAQLDFDLFLSAIVVSAVVIAMRFIWVLIVERIFGSADEIDKGLLKHSAILAFAGAKGAVTLTIMLTMPYAIASRSNLIFIASIVILITLILSNFIIPILCPEDTESEEERRKREAKISLKLVRGASERLLEDLDSIEDKTDQLAYQIVIDSYTKQAQDLKMSINLGQDSFNEELYELKDDILEWQIDYAKTLIDKYPKNLVRKYISSCEEQQERLEEGKKISITLHSLLRKLHVFNSRLFRLLGLNKSFDFADNRVVFGKIVKEVDNFILDTLLNKQLNNKFDKFRPETVATIVSEYQKRVFNTDTDSISVTQFIKSNIIEDDVRLKALGYEIEILENLYLNKDINKELMNKIKRRIVSQRIDLER